MSPRFFMTAPICDLVHKLSANFSNEQQAFNNPPLYAHITATFRPLAHLAPGSLLLEQSYAIAPNHPYRIRVLKVEIRDNRLMIFSHSILNEERYWGSVNDPERMLTIQENDLQHLEGCDYIVHQDQGNFIGEVEPGCRCLVERKKGIATYVVSKFELSNAGGLRTVDRGHDPITHEQVWGSLGGVFEFERTIDFSQEIPQSWVDTWREV
uniref:Chromophore lyase CpcT/CpeT n=1 Tax=Paulinella micropora TaxID=1928728 RepID=A0A385I0V0_9EUKA|nr:hypothetical protein PMNZ_620 [Paulinella micropora]AXY63551.1 hypothetical protein PMNZ_620 [Paulinella micropora]